LESAVVSSILFITLLIFFNHKSVFTSIKKHRVIAVSILLVSLWQLFPGLDFFGKVSGLNFVPANRSLLLSGLLLIIFLTTLINDSDFVLNSQRLTIYFTTYFFTIVYVMFSIKNRNIDISSQLFESVLRDIVFLSLSLLIVQTLIWLNSRGHLSSHRLIYTLGALSTPFILVGLSWNPIASSTTLFKNQDSRISKAIQEIQNGSNFEALAIYGFPGRLLYGQGFSSISDRPDIPDLNKFRIMFPKLPAEEFNYIFNRTAEVNIDPNQLETQPKLIQANLIRIPISVASLFGASVTPISLMPRQKSSFSSISNSKVLSSLDGVVGGDGYCHIYGWIDVPDVGVTMQVEYPSSWEPTSAMRTLRPDVLRAINGRGLYSGIDLRFKVKEPGIKSEIFIKVSKSDAIKWDSSNC
jgi:hypothetical protein